MAKATLAQLGVLVVTLVVLDLVLIATGLFPPSHLYGEPDLGWVAAPATGRMEQSACVDPITGVSHGFPRNENGHRSSWSASELSGPGSRFEIAVAGDSHTDLCSTNEDAHFGMTERLLTDEGVETAVFSYGSGRYSPLQAYLSMAGTIREHEADALVLNLYTGNDFYDMLRVDDRPHLVADQEGYRVEEPVWYLFDAPGSQRRSRVRHAIRSVGTATGLGGTLRRVQYLRDAASDQDVGIVSVLGYMNDLRKSSAPEVGYPAAFAAQILNQQLFFHHFPESREEAFRRLAWLMDKIRAEHPDMLLVMSPIPSYQLARERPVDQALLDVLERLPVSYEEGVAQEAELYERLRAQSAESGWIFSDNLTPIVAYDGDDRLYNDFDYHILPVASAIIAETQVEAILRHLTGEAGMPLPDGSGHPGLRDER